ncbi:response regulator [Achromobacter sp. SLBN-14]|uniref:response regulator n=1 Tax=Achromobacter sp. SLBN-14 TaxID=2768442 RepID=UPI00114D9EDA|nr:response regulator [Achromobacter sp. SLBN-14]
MPNTQRHERTGKLPVLVVDDDPDARWLLAALLEEAGYAVTEAKNADDALRCLANRSDIRAVLTDVQMPGTLDGFEFAMRLSRESPGIAVLLTSGRGHPSAHARPSGMKFLLKPWVPGDMLDQLETLLCGTEAVK